MREAQAMIRYSIRAAQLAGVLALAAPAAAEVERTDENSFLTRDEAVVAATPKEVWLALISPARWWNSAHTWSGDAANMKLTPQAGGCFCETIPEVDEPDRFTLEGSVEHMRVIQAFPERALVMRGSLGPLQPEPVTGVLSIALTEVEGGTRIVWTYNVGGFMRFDVPVIARAVDGVMSQQLAGLADLLGQVEMSGEKPAADEETEADAQARAAPDPISIDPEPVIEEAPVEPAPSVDEAFSDLAGEEGD
jgi:uncharacterized protein YndB with AHSA1/START domain